MDDQVKRLTQTLFVNAHEMPVGLTDEIESPVLFQEDELNRINVLNGTFEDRKLAWDKMIGILQQFDGQVFLIGLGAQGTVLLHCLLKMMHPWKSLKSIRVFDARQERRGAMDEIIAL